MKGFLIALAAAAAFAAASAKAATSMPTQQTAAAEQKDASNAANSTSGDWRKTWKEGANTYRFEGISGGCHYSGSVSPSGYHLDRSC
jgi:Ni/Co efflux regulator RcnB